MMCMSVDLPEPDGPMMAVNSPRRRPSETSSSAVTAPATVAVALAERGDAGDETEVGGLDLHVVDATDATGPRHPAAEWFAVILAG